jgi:hypothetical protein
MCTNIILYPWIFSCFGTFLSRDTLHAFTCLYVSRSGGLNQGRHTSVTISRGTGLELRICNLSFSIHRTNSRHTYSFMGSLLSRLLFPTGDACAGDGVGVGGKEKGACSQWLTRLPSGWRCTVLLKMLPRHPPGSCCSRALGLQSANFKQHSRAPLSNSPLCMPWASSYLRTRTCLV